MNWLILATFCFTLMILRTPKLSHCKLFALLICNPRQDTECTYRSVTLRCSRRSVKDTGTVRVREHSVLLVTANKKQVKSKRLSRETQHLRQVGPSSLAHTQLGTNGLSPEPTSLAPACECPTKGRKKEKKRGPRRRTLSITLPLSLSMYIKRRGAVS